MAAVTLKMIQEARSRISDVIYHSPCPYSMALSKMCQAQVYCKLDHLQMTGAFKERGARNKLLQLSPEQRKAGIVAASAGNHAMGLAYHGQLLHIPVTVVMPESAPLVKVVACRGFGAEVILHGKSLEEVFARAREIGRSRDKTFVSGFDDVDIIAGQGTIGLELLEEVPEIDAVICPVGGGGMVAGVGLVMKALSPRTKIIGVEPQAAPTLTRSLAAGVITRVPATPTLADGLAVAEVGGLNYEIARQVVDRMVLVDELQIARAVLRLMEMEKAVVEGAGAAPLAALLSGQLPELRDKKVVLVLSGGNIDMTVLGRIIERGLAADGRLTRLRVDLPERPGSLARLLTVIADAGASIKDIAHDRNFGPADIAIARVELTLETRDAAHIQEVHAALTKAGVQFEW